MDTLVTNIPLKLQPKQYYSLNNAQKCRLCLASLDTMIELFSDEAIQMKINEKLSEFCHLVVKEDDFAPRTICFTCLNEVNRFVDFYRRVQDNQKLLTLSYRANVDSNVRNENDILELEVVNTDDIVITIGKEEEVVADDKDENIEVIVAEEDTESHENEDYEDANQGSIYPPKETLEDCEESHNRSEGSACEEVDSNANSDNEPLAEQDNSSEHQENEPNVTDICNGEDTVKRRTKHRIALDRPIREFFDLRCEKCDMNFQTFQSIKNHMSRIHNEKFYFICCNRKLCRRDVIMEHIDSHLNPKKFTCEVCHQVCKSKITLKMHLKQHIPKDQQPFACEKCGYRFALKSQLKSHMNTHLSNEEKKFVCDQCGKPFAFKFVLEKHKKRMHVRQKNYMCEICARSFVDKVNLTAHKRVHDTSLPRLECHQCNALLKTKKTLKIHMRVHDPSQFPCELCSKVFPTKNGLLNHVRYYHTDRKYPCPTCGRIFKKALNLKEHMATHTGEVLYNCEYCDKTFNAKANRYAHIKKVHPAEWADKQKLRWRVENEKYSE